MVTDPNYAVGFNEFVGFRLVDWSSDIVRIELDMRPHHLNGIGIAHGGVLLAALDSACGMSGCYRAPPATRRLCMTMSLTTNFIRPLISGLLRAEARQTGGGKTVFYSDGKILDDDGAVVASASGVFRRLRDAQPQG